ncbi:MAG: ribonuclease III [Alphaproteobacteria bacterium]|nr:ribonuclease III [Alphaproteobacteria bacterium]
MTGAPRPIDDLAARIGYRFNDPALLEEALTHSSIERRPTNDRRDNDRLEFLGDRVLGLVVAHRLTRADPDADAGALARRFAALVREEALAEVARSLGLGEFLRFSRAEREAGGANKPAILADACEALIGALYLDGGLAVAEAFVERQWSEVMAEATAITKDPKTALQEWAQARGLAPPTYHDISRAGPDHDPLFTVEVEVSGFPRHRGDGANKRRAQQVAAAALLDEILRDE